MLVVTPYLGSRVCPRRRGSNSVLGTVKASVQTDVGDVTQARVGIGEEMVVACSSTL